MSQSSSRRLLAGNPCYARDGIPVRWRAWTSKFGAGDRNGCCCGEPSLGDRAVVGKMIFCRMLSLHSPGHRNGRFGTDYLCFGPATCSKSLHICSVLRMCASRCGPDCKAHRKRRYSSVKERNAPLPPSPAGCPSSRTEQKKAPDAFACGWDS